MASILDILSWRNISTAVQKVEPGIPDPMPSEFSTLTESVLGDRTTYVTFYGQRQTAKRGEYGAPSKARTLKQIGEQSVTLLHFPEHIKIRQELMLRLRNPNDLLAQQLAQQEIARHGLDFRQLFENTRIAAKILLVSKGKLWFDGPGNILPSSSGATLTVDYGIGANNQNQLNGIIDVSWANAAADIVQHIENVKIQMRRNTGSELEHAFYGANVANYVYKNTTAKAYFQYNPALFQSFQQTPGTIPNGTFGIKYWHRMGDSFMEDADGTVQALFGANQVTFAPAITRNKYTLYEGSIAVPKKYGIHPDVSSAVADVEVVYGMGGYAVPEIDPVGIKEVYFDTMLPHWKTPLDLFLATVAF